MTEPIYRTEFMRGEVPAAFVWLSIGALISLVLEVAYLGSRITLAGVSVPFPWPIVVAFFFNGVLTKTARLWTKSAVTPFIPLVMWGLAFTVALMWPAITGGQLLGNNMRTIVLLMAGIAGGVWPVVSSK